MSDGSLSQVSRRRVLGCFFAKTYSAQKYRSSHAQYTTSMVEFLIFKIQKPTPEPLIIMYEYMQHHKSRIISWSTVGFWGKIRIFSTIADSACIALNVDIPPE